MLRTIRIALWVLVALAAIGLIVVATRPPADVRPTVTNRDDPEAAIRIGGPFTLTDSEGRPFASQQLAGKPYALFFGFTHCPDVCPTTLSRLAKLRRALGKGDDAFGIVLVSVDPQRDTPAAMKEYAALFNTPLIALTGSPGRIDSVRQQFGVQANKVGAGEDYSVEHTATVFLMGRDGKFRATIAPEEGDPAALDKLRSLTS